MHINSDSIFVRAIRANSATIQLAASAITLRLLAYLHIALLINTMRSPPRRTSLAGASILALALF